MSAKPSPPAQPSLLAWPLNLATRIALRYPAATVSLAIAMTVLSLLVTWEKLGYKTSRLDLLNPESDYNRLWIEYINEFGDEDDAVVVVEGESRDQVVPVLQEISHMLSRAGDGCFMRCCTKSTWARSAPRGCTTCRRKN